MLEDVLLGELGETLVFDVVAGTEHLLDTGRYRHLDHHALLHPNPSCCRCIRAGSGLWAHTDRDSASPEDVGRTIDPEGSGAAPGRPASLASAGKEIGRPHV